jgi:hypothetical protein
VAVYLAGFVLSAVAIDGIVVPVEPVALQAVGNKESFGSLKNSFRMKEV